MKDLTHYFTSPPKSGENGAVSTDNQNTTLNTVVEEDEVEVKIMNENGVETPVKKRSRVKIKISVKDSKTRRCDIVDTKDDVIDKTPSPFTGNSNKCKTRKQSVSDSESIIIVDDCSNVNSNSDSNNPREETTANAFKVLMTQSKPVSYKVLPTPSSIEVELDLKKTEKYKNKLKNCKQKLITLADQKGYSKRKHAELEEAELIESRLEKRARLFRRNDKNDQEEQKGQNNKSNEDKARNFAQKKLLRNSIGSSNKSDFGSKKKKKNLSTSENALAKNTAAIHSESLPLSLTPPLCKDKTPRAKTKWTMRVKLQSYSDDEVSKAGGDLSDDDCIFTPKSKVKFRTTRIPKNSDKIEAKEEKQIENKKQDKKVDKNVDYSDSTPNTLSDVKGSKSLQRQKGKTKKNGIITPKDSNKNSTEDDVKKSDQLNSVENLNDSVTIIDENNAEINEYSSILVTKKLAPLFLRKSKSNPISLKARRDFLQSGIPKNVKKVIQEQKNSCNITGPLTVPFPIISHVSQLDKDIDSEESSESSYVTYKHKPELEPVTMSLSSSYFKSLSNLKKPIPEVTEKSKTENFIHVKKADIENVLTEIESRCSDTKAIWASISSSSNQTPKKLLKKRTKKLNISRKSNVPVAQDDPDNSNPTWPCKYKPTSSAEVVGNEAAITKLRNWLGGWKLPSPKDDYNSNDEFMSSDCSNSSYYENNQVAVLLGPHGSGKSASVYAIAEELGYRVLEVNASSRRTGKKILTDFQEATKSHRVKRDQKTLMPIKKKSSENKVPQNSLILIEDVDIIFEEDEGFVSATFQLAANTRRPIVMTCKESCPHLYRMAPQQQFIYFQAVTGNRVSTLLELISLTESGYRLPQSYLNTLLHNGDLRQSLLQLQFILLSGPPSVSQLCSNSPTNLWSDMRFFLYKPAIKHSKKYRKQSTDEKLIAEEDIKIVNGLTKKLDDILLISSLIEVENPTSPPWLRKLNPSLSLIEDCNSYSNSDDLSCEIADWLHHVSLKFDQSANLTNFDYRSQLSVKRKMKLGIDLALSQAIHSSLEHKSQSTDYLPVLRTMCRTEQERAKTNNKRYKRFHNYLHGLNIPSASNHILAAASSVFQDKFP